MSILTAHPVDKAQEKAIKAFFKALEVPYEEYKEKDKSPYNKEFVAKILQGDEDIKAGRVTKIKVEDLWK